MQKRSSSSLSLELLAIGTSVMSPCRPLGYIGALAILYVLLKLSATIYVFIRPSRLSKYLRKDVDTYALITGATDGIGLGFARELCRQGFGVILHGRCQHKLQRTRDILKDEYPDAQIRTFICDAALLNPPEVFDSLARELQDVNLTVLINNVGGQAGSVQGPYKSYLDYTHEQIDRVISVNTRFMTQLTRVLLPLLDRNGPSLILNMSSFAARGTPYVAVYSATKGYVKTFSAALAMEMRMQKKKIDVVALNVAEVQSGSHTVPTSLFIPTGRQFARSALKNVGYGSETVEGYWPHAVQGVFVDMIPEWMRQITVMRAVRSRIAALPGISKNVK
ncbi:short chain dehydrogenase [Coccidioides posadasii str. Silveira]|uniref:Short chain dehydrogenase n=2 Tax=Coccidioides posadasii (strain RMSCC 757 / Silveira) TaxID=443226 RepID=E9DDV9_COCPS|nr:short chain dehydrogenase [Coccidioides posadasii str. Silveira]